MNYKIYDQLPQEAKEIRIKVFMEEQGFKDEFDDLDDLCQHLVVFGNNQPIGTIVRRWFSRPCRQILRSLIWGNKSRFFTKDSFPGTLLLYL